MEKTNDEKTNGNAAGAHGGETVRNAEGDAALDRERERIERVVSIVRGVAMSPLGLYIDDDEDMGKLLKALPDSGVTADTTVACAALALHEALRLRGERRTYPWCRLVDGEVVEVRKSLTVYESTVDDEGIAALSNAVAAFARPVMIQTVNGKTRPTNLLKWRRARKARQDQRDAAYDVHADSCRMAMLTVDECMRGIIGLIDAKWAWRVRHGVFARTEAMRMNPLEWHYGAMLSETMRRCAGLRPLVVGDPEMGDDEFEATDEKERDLRRDRALCGSAVVASFVVPLAQLAQWTIMHPDRSLIG